MKKFSEFEYQRPSFEAVKAEFSELLKEFQEAESAEKQSLVMKKINRIRF